MTRPLIITAFLLGAIAIIWMGNSFIGSHALALTVTVVIGGVYLLGITELFQFRRATATLSSALNNLGDTAPDLEGWLGQLDPSLKNAVRLRIEGERVGLPAPVFTPYLVGLLVMLGLLGTFVGMVDTLQGAVGALEGTTELAAIRQGLAAPIKGLGLAFGTSVAGVAASAMLGLISTLSRRERMLATRELDRKIATLFRHFSLTHNRQETYKALQVQADALPQVAEQLTTLADKLETMGDKLGDKLLANQESFHSAVEQRYSQLAQSIDESLKQSLAESGRQAGDSIKPIVAEAMTGIDSAARQTHEQVSAAAREQLEALTGQLTAKVAEITDAVQAGLGTQQQMNETLRDTMRSSFDSFSGKFEDVGGSLLTSFGEASRTWVAQSESADRDRLERWSDSLEQSQEQANQQLVATAQAVSEELRLLATTQQQALQGSAGEFESLSNNLSAQWRQAGEQTLSLQQSIVEALATSARELSAGAQASSTELLAEIGTLLHASEELIQNRVASEQTWLSAHAEHMEQLTTATRTELGAMRDSEQLRAQAALEQFNQQHAAARQELDAQREAEESRSLATAQQMEQLTSAARTELTALRDAEELRAQQVAAKMDSLTSAASQELSALRENEELREQAAVERMAGLEATVATHLATLGKELEQPMSRLIETASETPKAAAEVIGQLRQEIGNNIERDNQLLEERRQVMEQLNNLAGSLEESSYGQSEAIERLVKASTDTLEDVGSRFSEQIGTEVTHMADVAANFAGSATELSSLGEAFTLAVNLFNDSNEKLMENLARIEGSMEQAHSRSDEQMGYYVAQAREVIDQSTLSQKELIEELRQLGKQEELFEGEAS